MEYLFVVTYGRSGSTLLSGLLNAIPGYVIRGENADALRHLYDFHTTLMTEKERRPRSGKPTHPSFGIGGVPRDLLTERTRDLVLDTVLRPHRRTRVTGFKEIRWWREDLEGYVSWLREVFPGARFLINTRDHESVLKSAWWARGDRQQKAEHLADFESRILALGDDLGDAAYRIHYDDYTADPTALRGLYEWLGEPWDEAAVRRTLAVRHAVGKGPVGSEVGAD